jgi:hypothetical protein
MSTIGDPTLYLGQPESLLEEAITSAGHDSEFTLPGEFDRSAAAYFIPVDLGLEAAIDRENQISRIHLHSEGHHDCAGYPFELPEGLRFSTDRAGAWKSLGEPDKTAVPTKCLIHKQTVCGDRWDRPKYSLHCEYPKSGDRILMITISTPMTS